MKARVKATGETIEVVPDSTNRYYHDSDLGTLVYGEVDLQFDSITDWNQVRIQAAIAATQAFCNDKTLSCEKTAKMAVSQADALVAELKKKGGQK